CPGTQSGPPSACLRKQSRSCSVRFGSLVCAEAGKAASSAAAKMYAEIAEDQRAVRIRCLAAIPDGKPLPTFPGTALSAIGWLPPCRNSLGKGLGSNKADDPLVVGGGLRRDADLEDAARSRASKDQRALPRQHGGNIGDAGVRLE